MNVNNSLSRFVCTVLADPRACHPLGQTLFSSRLAAGIVLSLLALATIMPSPTAQAQNQRVLAQCKPPPDPTDFDAVYRCFSSGVPLNKPMGACYVLADYYERLIERANNLRSRRSGETKPYMPSCELLVRVQDEMLGTQTHWKACLGYGSIPLEQHLQRCLTDFMPVYLRNGLNRMKTCADVREYYAEGLRSAHHSKNLPDGYQPPSCEVVAAFLTELKGQTPSWTACFGYAPDQLVKHMPTCLGERFASLQNCQQRKTAYEKALQAAYDDLPANYLEPRCSEVDAVVQAVADEEKRQAQLLQQQREAERRQQDALREEQRTQRERQLAAARASAAWWDAINKLMMVALALALGYYAYRQKRAGRPVVPKPIQAILRVTLTATLATLKRLREKWPSAPTAADAVIVAPTAPFERVTPPRPESPLSLPMEETLARIVQVRHPIWNASISTASRRSLAIAFIAVGFGALGLTILITNLIQAARHWF